MDVIDNLKSKRKIVTFIILLSTAIVLSIIGVVLIIVHKTTIINKKTIDYTECREGSGYERKCTTFFIQNEKENVCICYVNIALDKMIPKPVNVYYEFPDFDQTRAEYASSKDEAQLAGKLSQKVSTNCGNYSYEDTTDGKKKPIAPCGEIADSMLRDTFSLIINKSYVPSFVNGLDGITEEDKKQYHNPSGNLEAAFKDFASPRSWAPVTVTTLDVVDPSNNGFQNERFIAWMKTDLKRKPVQRINHTGAFEDGLPSGNYTLRIEYHRSNYVLGRRIATIGSSQVIINSTALILGIVLLIIGTCLAGFLVYHRIVYKSYYIRCKTRDVVGGMGK